MRKLLHLGFALAVITASIVTLARPVRSNLASDGVEGEVAFSNPYVTDGLVSMWDAEWNVGGGFHNPDSSVWVNIGNGGDMFNALVDSGGFSEDGFVGQATAIRPRYAAFTVSVVFAHLIGDNYFPITAYDNNAGGYRIWEFYGNSSYRIRWWAGRGNGAAWQTAFIPVETGIFQTYDLVVFSDGTKWVYYNGSRTQTSGSQTGYSDGTRLDISIGSPKCAIKRVSIYSRPLSPEEIRYNHYIDKARFGL